MEKIVASVEREEVSDVGNNKLHLMNDVNDAREILV